MRTLIKWLIAPLALSVGYFLGPQPDYPPLDGKINTRETTDLLQIEKEIERTEARVTGLKPDNQARILWADSVRRTPYSIVFLHGFSASPREGDPIVRDFARRFGCNVYLPRLAGHGLDDPDVFQKIHPQDLINSAKEAIAIGQQLGNQVIIMGSSTGCTLGAYLAAENPGAIHALFFYSPNFALANGSAFLLSKPWGAQLARLVHGGSNYRTWEPEVPEIHQYWTTTYHVEGLVCLQTLLDQTMSREVFRKINTPVFAGYYYKNEEEKDPVISVDAIHSFLLSISTPEEKKWAVSFSEVNSHVITCDLQCKDLNSVRNQTFAFAEQILGLSPRQIAH